jgi:hypothetical protein
VPEDGCGRRTLPSLWTRRGPLDDQAARSAYVRGDPEMRLAPMLKAKWCGSGLATEEETRDAQR